MTDYDLAIIGGGLMAQYCARRRGPRPARDPAGAGRSRLPRISLAAADPWRSRRAGAARLLSRPHRAEGARCLARDRAASGAPDALCDTGPCRRAAAMAVALLAVALRRLASRRRLPASATVDISHHPIGNALQRPFGTAFEYSDCMVDDFRLVCFPPSMPPSGVLRSAPARAAPGRPRRHLAVGRDRSRLSPGDHGARAGQRQPAPGRPSVAETCCACRRRIGPPRSARSWSGGCSTATTSMCSRTATAG